jgi:hypothetical protein
MNTVGTVGNTLVLVSALMIAGGKPGSAPIRQSHRGAITRKSVTGTGKTRSSKEEGAQKKSIARLEKSTRYNGGPCNLVMVPPDQVCINQALPRSLPVIPGKESDVILVGCVENVSAYLSTDKTHIYTESRVHVEDLLKLSARRPFPENREMIVDQIGGTLKLPSGRVIRDPARVDFLGRIRSGARYLLFTRWIHDGRDLTLIRGYELREGQVFKLTEDRTPGNVPVSGPSEEKEFIRAVRNALGGAQDSRAGSAHAADLY